MMNEKSADGAAELPPWLRPEIQQRMEWRDGDIVISVPIKSGTTWTMNIVHQLLSGGDPDFEDIYAEVPWIELLERPGQSVEDAVSRIDALGHDRPRAFKTHSAPPALPYSPSGTGKSVRYIVVCRNPEEALVSMRPFIAQHTGEWFRWWGLDRKAMVREDFPTFYEEVIHPGRMQGMVFGFLAAWWPLRHNDNVLMLHFADMKRDHEGSIHKIADFLGIAPSPEQWKAVVEYTSFAWMKDHQGKFELSTITEVPILQSGAMIRKGRVGEARSDGMTDEISARMRAFGRAVCPDDAALEWVYNGGPQAGSGSV